jgi:hypothetical protein
MFIAEASVATERANRYLVQLCRHIGQIAERHPQMRARVEWTEDRGVINFSWGRCLLRAGDTILAVRLEAADEKSLGLIERRVAERLALIGRRDGLTLAWSPARRVDDTFPPPASSAGVDHERTSHD